MTTQPFVLPVSADENTEAFFAATGAGFLPLHQCRACGTVNGPNELSCSRCLSTDLEQVPAAGGGRVVSFTVQHSKPAADGSTHRLVAVIVELDEGPWWWTQLAGVDPAAVRVGDRVHLEIVTPEGGRAVPIVRPG
jgi:uncharacterized OB-fold protein